MQKMTEEQKKKRRRALEWQVRYRWVYTAAYVLVIGMTMAVIIDTRSQWSSLFVRPIPSGAAILHTNWAYVAELLVICLALIQFWRRVNRYQREQLAAEQEALRKAATPPDGVWPPPPVS